ncbi:MAG: 4Fe-4S dicluster domain-containing protein [bacterium]|nr:4Fe-4S dicluster domain-containing protein [bacterium]
MAQKSFIFDLNKCTGCSACLLACEIENDLTAGSKWRNVSTFNYLRFPEIPVFHLSLACNHCVDPPCMRYCPASAYTKDEQTGAVILDQEKCIGCKYCSWVCPFDAPRYSSADKLMKKCTFCNPRLLDGKRSACVESCPTGALSQDTFKHDDQVAVPGFPESTLEPAIEFIPLRKQNSIPEFNAKGDDAAFEELIHKKLRSLPKKVSLISEWALLLFSFIAMITVSMFGAKALAGFEFEPPVFFGLGIFGMLISLTHLGKKTRAARAVMNFKRSWISREVTFFSVFLFLSFVSIILFKNNSYLNWFTVLTGFAAMFCIDKVYETESRTDWRKTHSGMILITGLFMLGIFSLSNVIIAWFGFLKIYFYTMRKFYFHKSGGERRVLLSIIRLFTGFVIPAGIWGIFGTDHFDLILIFVLLGEFIDRTEFYLELDFITPERKIYEDILIELRKPKKKRLKPSDWDGIIYNR